jgi:hypothetical protein
MSDIFIRYAQEDRAGAEAICEGAGGSWLVRLVVLEHAAEQDVSVGQFRASRPFRNG